MLLRFDRSSLCSIGAGTADLHAVQVHPTGLVEPSDPDAKVKWLAAEALRGCGGIILDREGNRFCDEVGVSVLPALLYACGVSVLPTLLYIFGLSACPLRCMCLLAVKRVRMCACSLASVTT